MPDPAERGSEEPPDEGAAALGRYAEAVEEGRDEDADEAMLEFLVELGKFAEEHAEDPYSLLLDRAHDRAEAGDWDGAEAAWRDAIAASESDNLSLLPRQRLIDLLLWIRRPEDALSEALLAVEAARRGDMEPVIVMALELESRCLFEVGDPEAAIDRAGEAIAVCGRCV